MASVSLVRVLAGTSVLELLRAPEATRPEQWDLPGGHAEKSEAPSQTAARELYEETGISVKPSTLTLVKAYARTDGKLFYIFELRTLCRPPIQISSEHTQYRWIEDDAPRFGRI